MDRTERLYYSDSECLAFSARVLAVGETAGRPSVILDQTAFYPTSGGQPHDLGTLDGVPVVDVIDAGEVIAHVLAGSPPPVGAQVAGQINAERRRDHMQQHSGQHVLSQAFEQVASLRTVSFHLGTESSTIDLDSAALNPAIVQEVEGLANQIVLEGRPVVIHFVDSTDLARFGLRKSTERTGLVRIVEIANFDRSACGGTHVRQTGQIGPIKVRRWERRGSTTRLEFLCGWRALRDYGARLETTRALAERLRTSDRELLAAASHALDELDRLHDEVARLRERLLEHEAADLYHEGTDLLGAVAARLIVRTYPDREPAELKRLALAVVRRGPAVVLLGSTGDRCHLVFAQHPGLPFDLSAILRQVAPMIGGRGGGTRDLAQGGAPGGAPVEPALAAARQLLLGNLSPDRSFRAPS